MLGGQALVKQAKLRTVVSDFQKYETAINTFLLSYNNLPGDFNRAQSYWGTTVNNGNGNNKITVDLPPYREGLDVWEHLYRADILGKNYIGSTASPPAGGNPVIAESNVPKSSVEEAMFAIFGSSAGFNIFNRDIHISLTLGKTEAIRNWCPWCDGVLTPTDARSIDSKIDDKIANSGKLFGVDGNSPAAGSCSAKYTTAGSDYNLSSSQKACRLFYIYR